jgi:quercetin dioxygenase-like cupin family protein
MANRPVSVVGPDQGHTYSGVGALTCKIPSDMTGNACTVLELRLQPGQGAGLHVHQREEEIIFVQRGTCTVGHADQTWELGAGSWAVFPRQTAHFFRNTGEGECTLIITAVPGGLDAYFAALSAAIDLQDAQAVAAVNTHYGITFITSG